MLNLDSRWQFSMRYLSSSFLSYAEPGEKFIVEYAASFVCFFYIAVTCLCIFDGFFFFLESHKIAFAKILSVLLSAKWSFSLLKRIVSCKYSHLQHHLRFLIWFLPTDRRVINKGLRMCPIRLKEKVAISNSLFGLPQDQDALNARTDHKFGGFFTILKTPANSVSSKTSNFAFSTIFSKWGDFKKC